MQPSQVGAPQGLTSDVSLALLGIELLHAIMTSYGKWFRARRARTARKSPQRARRVQKAPGLIWYPSPSMTTDIWVVVKIKVPFWATLNNRVPYYNRDPKRDHNFDNHPYGIESSGIPPLAGQGCVGLGRRLAVVIACRKREGRGRVWEGERKKEREREAERATDDERRAPRGKR